jgi:hypothetical protein
MINTSSLTFAAAFFGGILLEWKAQISREISLM